MKVVILAGGLGTRISEYTRSIPKPMVRIGNKPLLIHIMELYSKFNYDDFYIALGYKSEVVKNILKTFFILLIFLLISFLSNIFLVSSFPDGSPIKVVPPPKSTIG